MIWWLKEMWISHWQRKISQPFCREPIVSIHVPFCKCTFVFAMVGSETLVLAKIDALQNGSGIYRFLIRSWMHWFDHFLTKLSKYLWIKTGDRHYHFVEPWFMDRPFCRMETVYHNHFVEQMASPLQNGPLRPHPGNGNRDICSSQLGLTRSIQSSLI
jgi:hypothetical protein